MISIAMAFASSVFKKNLQNNWSLTKKMFNLNQLYFFFHCVTCCLFLPVSEPLIWKDNLYNVYYITMYLYK